MYDNNLVLLPLSFFLPLGLSSVARSLSLRVTGGELFEDIVAREYYSEADARWALPTYCYRGYAAA